MEIVPKILTFWCLNNLFLVAPSFQEATGSILHAFLYQKDFVVSFRRRLILLTMAVRYLH